MFKGEREYQGTKLGLQQCYEKMGVEHFLRMVFGEAGCQFSRFMSQGGMYTTSRSDWGVYSIVFFLVVVG